MLTPLGRRHDSSDIVELLLACHERIRHFLALARRLAEAAELSAAEARDAAEAVRRYFTQALPLHTRDEEESILPRLRGRDAALDAVLAAMAKEHRAHDPLVERLAALCQRIAADPTERGGLRDELARTVAALERELAAHLSAEEAVIFPALRALVSPAEQAVLVDELRGRRSAPV